MNKYKLIPFPEDSIPFWHASNNPKQANRYVVPFAVKLTGSVSVLLIEKAFSVIINRHDILRTHIYEDRVGRVFYKVYSDKKIVIEEEVTCVGLDELQYWIARKIQALVDNINDRPLLEVCLLKGGGGFLYLVILRHHLVSDGESLSIILSELNQIYNSYYNNVSETLSKPKQYFDFIREKRTLNFKEGVCDYWERKCRKIAGWLRGTQTSTIRFSLGVESILLTRKEVGLLKELSASIGVSQFAILSSLLALTHMLLVESNKTVVYIPVSRRNKNSIDEHLLGNCVSPCLGLFSYQKDTTLKQFFIKTSHEITSLNQNAEYPYSEILSKLPKAYLNQDQDWPLAFVKSVGLNCSIQLENVNSEVVIYNNDHAIQADLSVEVYKSEFEGKPICLRYNRNNISADFVSRFIKLFRIHLNASSSNYNKYVSEVVSDYHAKLTPQISPLIKKFHDVLKTFPDKVAVEYGSDKRTYSELNQMAEALAHELIKYDLKANNRVIVMLPGSVDYLIAIIACMKCGITFVPVLPEFPEKHLDYIINDSGATHCLSTSSYITKQMQRLKVILIETVSLEGTVKQTCSYIPKPNDLVYIIYTSSTTGLPKGVMVSQNNLISLFKATERVYDISSKDIVCAAHTISFDFSIWEIFSALMYGAKLVFIKKDVVLNASGFFDAIVKNKITILNQTPSSFYRLIKYLASINNMSSFDLRLVILGGEDLKTTLLKELIPCLKQLKIYNMYGITEGTIHSTYKLIDSVTINSGISNIGCTLPGISSKILDRHLCEVSEGELYLSGGTITKGYLNKSNLTRQNFVNIEGSNEVWLKTGDLVKKLTNGDLVYVARSDRQISLRGYRVEPSAIEKALHEVVDIDNAHVMKCQLSQADERLICFLEAKYEAVDKVRISKELREVLPAYMVPSDIIVTESLPLTMNGKINEKLLLESYLKNQCIASNLLTDNSYSTVSLIQQAWSQTLGANITNKSVNFFDAGGHSLLLTELQHNIESKLKRKISIMDLFTYPSINGLADWIDSSS